MNWDETHSDDTYSTYDIAPAVAAVLPEQDKRQNLQLRGRMYAVEARRRCRGAAVGQGYGGGERRQKGCMDTYEYTCIYTYVRSVAGE